MARTTLRNVQRDEQALLQARNLAPWSLQDDGGRLRRNVRPEDDT